MPDGVVQWFDAATAEAAIVRGGKLFRASAEDLEPVARHPGARVHFDIHRDHGVERAVDVTLRPGTRVSHQHRHFGTLEGARRSDTKGSAPFAHPHPELGRSGASHPLEVARVWARCMQSEDLDAAMLLYSPDAQVHAGGQTFSGRSHLKGYLEASPLLGIEHDAEVRGEDGAALVRWDHVGVEQRRIEVRCRIEHGQLAEQWIGPAAWVARPVTVPNAGRPFEMEIVTGGHVDDDIVAYAVLRLGVVAEQIVEPVLFARAKLSHAADPARDRPAIAQVAFDIDGQLVRAHVAGHSMREAIDLLQRRLRAKLEDRAEHREAERNRNWVPEPGEWRHGDIPTARPDYYDRSPDERELVRHKSFAVGELTPDEAAFDMEQLDYDFHLFRDLASGEDANIERHPDHTYRLTRLHPADVASDATAIAVTVDEHPAPQLTVRAAIERLNADGERFVFFANQATGRGNVLYHRYDGHYGLISPE